MTIGDGNDIRGDVGGNIARLRLDDGQSRQAAAAQLIGELGRALQQTGVQGPFQRGGGHAVDHMRDIIFPSSLSIISFDL